MTPITPSDRLAEALEKAHAFFESIEDGEKITVGGKPYDCTLLNTASYAVEDALSAYREGKGTEDHIADVAPDRAPVSNSTPDEAACEDHPCGLCDSAGRCTFACETAESVPGPDRHLAMLVLAAEVLDDLAEPDPALRRMDSMRSACARLRDEIRATLSDGPLSGHGKTSQRQRSDQKPSGDTHDR